MRPLPPSIRASCTFLSLISVVIFHELCVRLRYILSSVLCFCIITAIYRCLKSAPRNGLSTNLISLPHLTSTPTHPRQFITSSAKMVIRQPADLQSVGDAQAFLQSSLTEPMPEVRVQCFFTMDDLCSIVRRHPDAQERLTNVFFPMVGDIYAANIPDHAVMKFMVCVHAAAFQMELTDTRKRMKGSWALPLHFFWRASSPPTQLKRVSSPSLEVVQPLNLNDFTSWSSAAGTTAATFFILLACKNPTSRLLERLTRIVQQPRGQLIEQDDDEKVKVAFWRTPKGVHGILHSGWFVSSTYFAKSLWIAWHNY